MGGNGGAASGAIDGDAFTAISAQPAAMASSMPTATSRQRARVVARADADGSTASGWSTFIRLKRRCASGRSLSRRANRLARPTWSSFTSIESAEVDDSRDSRNRPSSRDARAPPRRRWRAARAARGLGGSPVAPRLEADSSIAPKDTPASGYPASFDSSSRNHTQGWSERCEQGGCRRCFGCIQGNCCRRGAAWRAAAAA